MYYHSKIITMFAVSITSFPTNAGSQLAFTVQAFFMPGHIVYHIWYPCTPVWSVNAPTAFVGCDRQRERHGYFHFKNLLLCLTMQKFLQLPTTASERLPTKRVLLPSPSQAILTQTLPPTVSISTHAPCATCARPIKTVTPSPDGSTYPGVKRLPEQPATNLSSSSWWGGMRNAAAMWQNAISASVSAILHLGNLATRSSRSTIVTSHLCNHLHKLVNHYSIAQPAMNVDCAGIPHPKS